MKLISQACGLMAVLWIAVGCASTPSQNLKRIQIGMEKPAVIDAVGSPGSSFRKNEADFWVYTHYQGPDKLRTTLRFREGRVVFIDTRSAYASEDEAIAKSNDIEQFKQIVDEQKARKNSSTGFQDIE